MRILKAIWNATWKDGFWGNKDTWRDTLVASLFIVGGLAFLILGRLISITAVRYYIFGLNENEQQLFIWSALIFLVTALVMILIGFYFAWRRFWGHLRREFKPQEVN